MSGEIEYVGMTYSQSVTGTGYRSLEQDQIHGFSQGQATGNLRD
jgi:hypothetical protein